jgi:hypothetical protein
MSKFDDMVVSHAGELSTQMIKEGFRSVFEQIMPSAHNGPKIYIFWVNLASGEARLTCTQAWQSEIFDVKALSGIQHPQKEQNAT